MIMYQHKISNIANDLQWNSRMYVVWENPIKIYHNIQFWLQLALRFNPLWNNTWKTYIIYNNSVDMSDFDTDGINGNTIY